MFDGYMFAPVGAHTTNSSLSGVVTLSPPSENAQVLAIQAFTKAVRYTLDGTTPTSSTGFSLAANDSDLIPCAPGQSIKVIEAEASASIQYQWLNIVGVI